MKNYALITQGIEDLLIESYENNDKKTVKTLLSELKKNPKLKVLYAVVDNLKNGEVPVSEVEAFIKENIEVAKSIDFSEFDRLIKESKDDQQSELLTNIGILLFKTKNIANISEHYAAMAYVKNHLIELNSWESKYVNEVQQMLKETSTLSNEDKLLFEQFLVLDENGKKQAFDNLSNECISILNEQIKGVDDKDIKLKLYETKDKIASLEFNKTSYVENLVVLHTLKKDLL